MLNIDLGIRYSDYSLFGKSTKGQAKLEWKPVSDLLLRGTFAQVFRVPTLIDLYAAPLNTSSTFADPCYGTNAASVAANPNVAKACDGAWQQNGQFAYNGTSQVTGLIQSNPNLKPETGHVWTTGFVLQVPGVENLSITADYWNYFIDGVITTLDPNYSSDQCLATGADQFCGLIHRYTSGNNQGEVQVFAQPVVNLGVLKTDGVDGNINYKLNNTPIGKFVFDLSLTHINKYDSIPIEATGDQCCGTLTGSSALCQAARPGTAPGLRRLRGYIQVQYIDSLSCSPARRPCGGQESQSGSAYSEHDHMNTTVGYTVKRIRPGSSPACRTLPTSTRRSNIEQRHQRQHGRRRTIC